MSPQDPAPHHDSILVHTTPDELYAIVSDVTRTGEWSPVCRECWWDEGDGPEVGAWFTGRNQTAERTWETRSRVVVAEPGREFAWQVGGSLVRWGYTLRPSDGATSSAAAAPPAGPTELTEHWEFLPAGLATFRERYGARAEEEIAIRTRAARDGIPATLAAIKGVAESVG